MGWSEGGGGGFLVSSTDLHAHDCAVGICFGECVCVTLFRHTYTAAHTKYTEIQYMEAPAALLCHGA